MAYGFNNEEIGISAEVAIAHAYRVPISRLYEQRANVDVVNMLLPNIRSIFNQEDIPTPIEHIAEGQNPVDFILADGKTLSVKTNQQFSKKVAPQNVGQPTSSTYFQHFSRIYGNNIPDDYRQKCQLFKRVSIERIDEVMAIYWNNLFHCDYLLHFYNIVSGSGIITNNAKYIVYPYLDSRDFDKTRFSFTQCPETWNESNTVKYYGIMIGEFQVHNNRDCFKFRFNMDGIDRLIMEGII